MPRDRQYIFLAPGGNHVFHKELMISPMDHLHRFQELLRISEKLPASNIPKWLYMSFHKSDRVEFICSGNKLSEETHESLAEYFQNIHNAQVSDGSLQRKRDDQIRQSTRRKMRGELEKKVSRQMSHYTYSRDKRQKTNADVTTTQHELRAQTIVNGTIVVVPKRILEVTARPLQRNTTRILNPATCMERNPSIRITSAGVIPKTQARN